MEDIYFSVDNVKELVWVCMGVAALCMLWLLTAYRGRVARCRCAAMEQAERYGRVGKCGEGGSEPEPCLGVSVIVYAVDNAKDLECILPQLFSQRYGGEVEVIVVNDGSSAEVTDVIKFFSQTHKNLYQTFVPDEAHNLSRRKLGISLGIKAARHPYVVLTGSQCSIGSDEWLSLMVGPFAEGKDVSLGFAHMARLKRMSDRFDEVATAVTWLSAALRNRPYRGIWFNLGYKRSLFFDAKGFSKSLTLHNGDDDMFVNQIVTRDNCGVVLAPGSIVEINSSRPSKFLRDLRLSHCFTGRFIPHGSRRFFGFATFVMWLWLAAIVVGIVFSLPNALPACVFAIMLPGLMIPLSLLWKRTSTALGIGLNAWLTPWFMMWQWVRNFRYAMRCGRASRHNYTWLQH